MRFRVPNINKVGSFSKGKVLIAGLAKRRDTMVGTSLTFPGIEKVVTAVVVPDTAGIVATLEATTEHIITGTIITATTVTDHPMTTEVMRGASMLP